MEDSLPSVGIDDLEVLPLLSSGGQSESGKKTVQMYVPSKSQLTEIRLDTLVMGGSIWPRIHVTAALSVNASQDACEYEVHIVSNSTLAQVGCQLKVSHIGVRGAYAECQIHVPLDLQQETLEFMVEPVQLENPVCFFSKYNDFFLVS